MHLAEATARCWAEIDLDALCDNYLNARRLAGDAQVICVLKGNAYGLGAIPVARALLARGARLFAVADGDEAEELLRAVPQARVLVLGLVGEIQAARLAKKGAVFTLYGFDQLPSLQRASEACGEAVRVHLKLDTGLHRLGFTETDLPRLAGALMESGLQTEGLFTHLALHDAGQDADQIERFLAVRTGAWLYGVEPLRNPHPGLCRPTVAFKTRVTQVHSVQAGALIGYDDDHPLCRDSRVATLACGYLDGVPRLNNEGFVEIRQKRARVLGLVCMDQMMVDVTDVPGVSPGDEVTLLGGGINVNEYAKWGRLNRNEALGRLGRRVTRVYSLAGETRIYNAIQEGEGSSHET